MRRIKRTTDFNLSLEIKNNEYLKPPRDSQRNWMVNQALKEFSWDLDHLDKLAKTFVRGGESGFVLEDRANSEMQDEDIMEDWQIPVMEAMVEVAMTPGARILEVGFGRGVASDLIQSKQPKSHTIVECNKFIIDRFNL